jgi:drug/metabolite transporter (DMT)-like permease
MTAVVGRSRTAGMGAALFAVTIWAGWIPVTRLGVVTHLQPSDVAALRYGTAGLVLLPYLWRHRHQLPWGRPRLLALVAAGAGVPYFATFGMGLRLANSGQAAVFGPGASSLFTVLIARLWLGEAFGLNRWIGMLFTLAGFALVVCHDWAGGGARLTGFGLILLASLAWALFTVASRRLALPPLVTSAWVGVSNALIYIPFYLTGDGPSRITAAPLMAVGLQATYQGVLTGTIAMTAFSFAVARLGAAGAAGFTPLTPVMAGFIGWWILGDTLDWATGAGLAAVAAGVIVGSGALQRLSARR